jgi:hypothetical protein
MKQIYMLMLVSVSSVFLSKAQIQITQANMPSLNDTIRYTNDIGGLSDYTVTGANHHWDFSSLGRASQDIYNFKSLLSAYPTLILNGMPLGAFGYKVTDSIGMGAVSFKNIYNFYEKKAAGWYGVGTAFSINFSGNPVPTGGVYSDKDEIYTFPLKFNDKDSTTFNVATPLGLSQSISFGKFMQKGYRINQVEGWGTITTPYAQNISCIKVKSRIVEHDSVSLAIPTQQPINIGFPTIRVEYKWLSNTEKIPMLEVIGTETGGVFTPTIVRYRDHFRGTDPVSGPRPRFNIDKTKGQVSKDTFRLINLTQSPPTTSYLWTISPSKGVRFVANSSATSFNPVLVFDTTGVFSITLKATNTAGTKDTTAPNLVTITKDQTSIGNIPLYQVNCFPNPVSGMVYFSDQAVQGKSYRIIDLCGRIISEGRIGTSPDLDCSMLETGVYTLIIQINTSTLIHKQIIKE